MKQQGHASLEYLIVICIVLILATNGFVPAYNYAVTQVFHKPNLMINSANELKK